MENQVQHSYSAYRSTGSLVAACFFTYIIRIPIYWNSYCCIFVRTQGSYILGTRNLNEVVRRA